MNTILEDVRKKGKGRKEGWKKSRYRRKKDEGFSAVSRKQYERKTMRER